MRSRLSPWLILILVLIGPALTRGQEADHGPTAKVDPEVEAHLTHLMTVTTAANEEDEPRGEDHTQSPTQGVVVGLIHPLGQGPDHTRGHTVDRHPEVAADTDLILVAVTVVTPHVPIVLDLDHALPGTPELFNQSTIIPEPTIWVSARNLKRKISSRIKINRIHTRIQISKSSLRLVEPRLRRQLCD